MADPSRRNPGIRSVIAGAWATRAFRADLLQGWHAIGIRKFGQNHRNPGKDRALLLLYQITR